MKDTWICKYIYNKHQQLQSVVARSAEEIRFTKKVYYQLKQTVGIDTYLNIESRQTTNRSLIYGPNERSPLKWSESHLETGKNRETYANVKLTWHDLGMLRKQEPSIAEIFYLLKPLTLEGYTKKHID